jgi:hypothetical protein
MTDITGEKHLDSTTNNQSENLPDEINSVKNSQLVNLKLETENMEVHAHDLHKAPGQGWKHYIFEFLMLFLAVFCGFLAENYRESRAEHQRAHELVVSLLGDLQHDTAQINMLTKFRESKKQILDSLIFLLQSPSETIKRNSFYTNLMYTYGYLSFSQASGTISQLKNAGYLRYFSDNDLIRMISNYEFSVQDYKEDEGFEIEFLNHNFRDFVTFNLDNSILTQLIVEHNHPEGAGILFYKPDGMRDLKAIINQLKFYNYAMQYGQDPKLKAEAGKLMDYLHHQFHLK